MLRRLFTLLFALSLLLCVATSALWVRSYWRTDRVATFAGDGYGVTTVAHGRLTRLYQSYAAPRASDTDVSREWRIGGPAGGEGDYGPIATNAYSMRSGHFFTSMAHNAEWWSIPLWWLIVPPAIFSFPLLALIKKRRPGFCRSCGYDLRATPDRCPECGTAK